MKSRGTTKVKCKLVLEPQTGIRVTRESRARMTGRQHWFWGEDASSEQVTLIPCNTAV
jgi:hypothetical protein